MIRHCVAGGVITLVVAGYCSAFAGEVALYDTGRASTGPVQAADIVARPGWIKADEGKPFQSFRGDAALANDQVALIARRGGAGVEVYGIAGSNAAQRAVLVPLIDGSRVTVSAVKAVSADDDAVSLEVEFKSGQGVAGAVLYSLTKQAPVCKSTPARGVKGQRTEAPCRFGVLPDFFADDMLIDSRSVPIERTQIPGEHFFMHLAGAGESIVTLIWDKETGDPELTLEGGNAERKITGSEIAYGAGGAIWTAVLEGKGMWGTGEITSNNVKNVTALDWKPPFVAKWKGDFARVDRTVDCWEMRYGRGGACWSGVGHSYLWPFWCEGKDSAVKACIQPALSFPNAKFSGAFVTYPIDRTAGTPVSQLTITDLMRNSLGVGPCEYITDVAGQGVKDKGLFTCAVADMTPAFFYGNRQKEERVFMRRMFQQTQIFVRVIGDRINSYVDFRADTLKYLAEQKAAHPELSDFIGRLEGQTKLIHGTKVDVNGQVSNLVVRLEGMMLADRPAGSEQADTARKLTEEGCEGSIAAAGGWQDGVVARCRNSVKMLRQIASAEVAVNPRAAEVSKEIRKRSQQALRGPLGHEM